MLSKNDAAAKVTFNVEKSVFSKCIFFYSLYESLSFKVCIAKYIILTFVCIILSLLLLQMSGCRSLCTIKEHENFCKHRF